MGLLCIWISLSNKYNSISSTRPMKVASSNSHEYGRGTHRVPIHRSSAARRIVGRRRRCQATSLGRIATSLSPSCRRTRGCSRGFGGVSTGGRGAGRGCSRDFGCPEADGEGGCSRGFGVEVMSAIGSGVPQVCCCSRGFGWPEAEGRRRLLLTGLRRAAEAAPAAHGTSRGGRRLAVQTPASSAGRLGIDPAITPT